MKTSARIFTFPHPWDASKRSMYYTKDSPHTTPMYFVERTRQTESEMSDDIDEDGDDGEEDTPTRVKPKTVMTYGEFTKRYEDVYVVGTLNRVAMKRIGDGDTNTDRLAVYALRKFNDGKIWQRCNHRELDCDYMSCDEKTMNEWINVDFSRIILTTNDREEAKEAIRREWKGPMISVDLAHAEIST